MNDASGDEARGLVEAVLVPPSGLVPTLLVALLVVAAWATLQPAHLAPLARPDLRLTAWQEGAAQLRARREAQVRPSPAPDEEAVIADGISAWLSREATQGVAGVSADPAARADLAATEERLRTFGLRYGRGAIIGAANRWAVRVRAAVERQGAPNAAPTAPGQASPETLQHVAPGMARAIERAGVGRWRTASSALQPAAALVVEGLASQRYLAFARRSPAPRPELDSALKILLLRFRVEAHSGLSLRRRLLLAEELAVLDPAWPSTWTTAVLLARARRFRGAQIWFERAAAQGEHAAAARQNARWCRQQLRLRP